jgi:hypothetical protein
MNTINEIELNNHEGTNFNFEFDLFPNIKYYLTELVHPGLSIGTIDRWNGKSVIPFHIPSTAVEYGELSFNFIIGEYMKNYQLLLYWMLSMIEGANVNIVPKSIRESSDGMKIKESLIGNGILYIGNKNINESITNRIYYKEIFPISIGSLTYTSNELYKLMTCDVTLKFTYYEFMD